MDAVTEKLEIIRTVEVLHLPVKRTLSMIGIASGKYYDWYAHWIDGGPEALADRSPWSKAVWNRTPGTVPLGLRGIRAGDVPLLAPDLVEAILDGRQGPQITLERLMEPFSVK